MQKTFLTALLCAGALCAQTPNLTGVWKADLSKSKTAGPAPQNILVILEQKDEKITELTGTFTQRGERRNSLTYTTAAGKASNNMYRGASMRSTAKWEGNTLTVDSKIAQTKPATMLAKYTVAADGKSFTLESTLKTADRESVQTLVFEKQADAAGEPLRKPEKTASEVEKNVTVLGSLPASQFSDAMQSFNIALGVECTFCHVQGDFAKDDRPQKAMARKMITMTHEINKQAFEGKNEVKCYTCHAGAGHPASHPAYAK